MLGPRVRAGAVPMAVLVLAAVVLATSAARKRGTVPAAGRRAPHGPVVVELFTSQGCSSCPPADRLLSRLKRDPRLAGTVLPLAFHVDYWNHLGWSDPFSSQRWSQRQLDYARAFHSSRIYTPQLMVDGRTECVGSEESLVMSRIQEALAAEPAGVVTLAPSTVAAESGGGGPGTGAVSAKVTVTARLLRQAAGASADLWVALTESGLTTPVQGGENATATLHNDQVVRLLVKALTLRSAAGAGAEGSAAVTLSIDSKWNRSALDVVAFLQDPQSQTIYGAASQPLIGR